MHKATSISHTIHTWWIFVYVAHTSTQKLDTLPSDLWSVMHWASSCGLASALACLAKIGRHLQGGTEWYMYKHQRYRACTMLKASADSYLCYQESYESGHIYSNIICRSGISEAVLWVRQLTVEPCKCPLITAQPSPLSQNFPSTTTFRHSKF